jgi:hypothetical protein
VHRADVFAQQHADGSYRPVKRPLDDMDIEEHLGGMASYGVYVIDPHDHHSNCPGAGGCFCYPNTVKYVVFDLDTYNPRALEWLTERVARLVVSAYGGESAAPADCEKCLLLETSGGKGYHIWLFLSEPVPAERVRYWTQPIRDDYKRAAEAFDDDWPELEIFPKQDVVPEGECGPCKGTGLALPGHATCRTCKGTGRVSGYGNLVKLPFGVHAKSGKRSEVVCHPGWAESVYKVVRFPSDLIPEVPEDAKRKRHETEGRVAPFPCISKLLTEGIGKGARDRAMFHFAHYALGTGMPEDMVREWADRVNENFDPPLTDFEVEKCVRSAASMSAPHPGCNADWLQGFCPGGGSCHAPWNKEKPERPARRQPITRGRIPSREEYLARRSQ